MTKKFLITNKELTKTVKKEKKNLYENNTRPGQKLQISYQYVKKKISNNANREMVARQYAGVNGVSSQLVL